MRHSKPILLCESCGSKFETFKDDIKHVRSCRPNYIATSKKKVQKFTSYDCAVAFIVSIGFGDVFDYRERRIRFKI